MARARTRVARSEVQRDMNSTDYFVNTIWKDLPSYFKDLKEHGQLVHMRIRYHFIANLHITLHHKTRERRTETEKRINKPCRIEVFTNQSSGYIHVTLLQH